MPVAQSIGLEQLSEYFHLPINDVAKELGICATVLKKICRRNGIPRWPHRKIKSIDKRIRSLETSVAKNPDEEERIKQEISTLRSKKIFLMKNPNVLLKQNKFVAQKPHKTPSPMITNNGNCQNKLAQGTSSTSSSQRVVDNNSVPASLSLSTTATLHKTLPQYPQHHHWTSAQQEDAVAADSLLKVFATLNQKLQEKASSTSTTGVTTNNSIVKPQKDSQHTQTQQLRPQQQRQQQQQHYYYYQQQQLQQYYYYYHQQQQQQQQLDFPLELPKINIQDDEEDEEETRNRDQKNNDQKNKDTRNEEGEGTMTMTVDTGDDLSPERVHPHTTASKSPNTTTHKSLQNDKLQTLEPDFCDPPLPIPTAQMIWMQQQQQQHLFQKRQSHNNSHQQGASRQQPLFPSWFSPQKSVSQKTIQETHQQERGKTRKIETENGNSKNRNHEEEEEEEEEDDDDEEDDDEDEDNDSSPKSEVTVPQPTTSSASTHTTTKSKYQVKHNKNNKSKQQQEQQIEAATRTTNQSSNNNNKLKQQQ